MPTVSPDAVSIVVDPEYDDRLQRRVAGVILNVLAIALVAGCERHQQIAASLVLSSVPVRVAPARPLRAPGPKMELCLVLAPGYAGDLQAPLRVKGPGASSAVLDATLYTVDGGSIPNRGGGIDGTDECFEWDVSADAAREVSAIELRAVGARIDVRAVTWWSGDRRHGFL